MQSSHSSSIYKLLSFPIYPFPLVPHGVVNRYCRMETWMNCSLEENERLLRFQTARPSEGISFRNPKSTGKKAVPMKKKIRTIREANMSEAERFDKRVFLFYFGKRIFVIRS